MNMEISRIFIPGMRTVEIKVEEDIKTHFLCTYKPL